MYNYFYDGTAITGTTFKANVPEDWKYHVFNGEYSYGYYRAVERD